MYFKISDYKIYTPFAIISLDKFDCEFYFQAKIISIKLSIHHLKYFMNSKDCVALRLNDNIAIFLD